MTIPNLLPWTQFAGAPDDFDIEPGSAAVSSPRLLRFEKYFFLVCLILGAVLMFMALAGCVDDFGIFWSGAASSHFSASASPEEIAEYYRSKVYFISTEQGAGSGILLAQFRKKGLLLTNLHVVDLALLKEQALHKTAPALSRVALSARRSPHGDNRPVRWAAFHRSLDAALLIVEEEADQAWAACVAMKNKVKHGEPVVSLGNPLRHEHFTSVGVIANAGREGKYIGATCPTCSANGGEPLFLARGGMLVGISSPASERVVGFALREGTTIVPADEIVASLKNRQTHDWVWEQESQEEALDLADLVTLEK